MMSKASADVNDSIRRYLEEWYRKVKFSAEEMAEILDDVAWILAHRYRETAAVPMEEWVTRIASELAISQDRKATKEHGQPVNPLPLMDAQMTAAKDGAS